MSNRAADALSEIREAMPRIADGVVASAVPFLSFIRSSKTTRRTPGILRPSLCLIVQGRKQILIGDRVIRYAAGDYIIASIDMPVAGHIATASADVPYLALKLDLDGMEIAALVSESELAAPRASVAAPAAYVATADAELLDAMLRLVRVARGPARDVAFLAPRIKQEILYRLLTTAGGARLWQNIIPGERDRGIGKAIDWIKTHLDEPMRVERLARSVNMSASSFHRKFKALTTMGPLQYQKQLRLSEARSLLLTGSVDAATAALRVGYESPSQFSREYRRLFGAPPRADVSRLLASPAQLRIEQD